MQKLTPKQKLTYDLLRQAGSRGMTVIEARQYKITNFTQRISELLGKTKQYMRLLSANETIVKKHERHSDGWHNRYYLRKIKLDYDDQRLVKIIKKCQEVLPQYLNNNHNNAKKIQEQIERMQRKLEVR